MDINLFNFAAARNGETGGFFDDEYTERLLGTGFDPHPNDDSTRTWFTACNTSFTLKKTMLERPKQWGRSRAASSAHPHKRQTN